MAPSHPLLLTLHAASELSACWSPPCHFLHLFLYPPHPPLSFLSPSLTDKLPIKSGNNDTGAQHLSLFLPSYFLSFPSSCSWRVSQPCLSSRTKYLITQILRPNTGIPFSLTLFLFFLSTSLFPYPLSPAAVTCQCQPKPSLCGVSLVWGIPLSALTHAPSLISHTPVVSSFCVSPRFHLPLPLTLYFFSFLLFPTASLFLFYLGSI